MTAEVLREMLVAAGAEQVEGAFRLPGDGATVSLMLSTGSSVMSIEAKSVSFSERFATVRSDRDERYFIDPAVVFALKVGLSDRARGAGFGR